MPLKSAKPVRASVITLTALVSRKSTAERSATRCPGAPRSISSQAPDGDAARSAQRHRSAEGQLAERHPGPKADRRAVEHLEEGEHVPEAGEHLQPDRGSDPPGLHMGDLVGDAVKTRDCQQQARDERDEHGHRDEPAGKAPAALAASSGSCAMGSA